MEQSRALPTEVDLTRPSAARVYDYFLGGAHNFEIDRQLAEQIAAMTPNLADTMRAGRAFLRRAVAELTRLGIDQFLDIGSGIPTVGNVHEVAQGINPEARIVYVDIDPVAVAHSRSILDGQPAHRRSSRPTCATRSRSSPRRGRPACIDFARPVGVLLAGVVHFVPDGDDPERLMAALRDAVRAGQLPGRSRTRPTRTSRRRCSTRRSCRPAPRPRSRCGPGPRSPPSSAIRAARAGRGPHATVAAGLARRRRRPPRAVRRLRWGRPKADRGLTMALSAPEVSTSGAQRYAGRWAQAIARRAYVPMSTEQVERAAGWCTRCGSRRPCAAEEFSAEPAREVGRALVEASLTEPDTLGWSLRALGADLVDDVVPGLRPAATWPSGSRRCRPRWPEGFASRAARPHVRSAGADRPVGLGGARRGGAGAARQRGPVPGGVHRRRDRHRHRRPDGQIIDVNQAFADMLGYSRDELREINVSGAVPRRGRRRDVGALPGADRGQTRRGTGGEALLPQGRHVSSGRTSRSR